MVVPESRLFCRLDGLSPHERSHKRSSVLQDLGLIESESVPVFEEVVQTAAHFLEMPMALLSVIHGDRELLKATFGLSRLGLMNELVRSRSIELNDSYGTHVVDSHQVLAIEDTQTHSGFEASLLAQYYGIRSYVGVPLVTSQGEFVGVLSVLDTQPRAFSLREIEFLMMTARFGMSEYERLQALRVTPRSTIVPNAIPLKFKLVAHLTQELRTPLTSVMGMASMLNREIYGPLTLKQREYLSIIHNSGDYLFSLVKEILELSQLDLEQEALNLAPLDVEMLCQQAIGTLQQAIQRREQEIRLTIEPGNRIWVLDKEKMRQMLYHLIFSVVQASNAGSIIHLHAANKSGALRLTLWVTHPCLESVEFSYSGYQSDDYAEDSERGRVMVATNPATSPEVGIQDNLALNLGFILSQQLVELHGGEIQVKGQPASGYRYNITLPRLTV
jgi:signal transduction histidine kinase